MVEKIPAIGTNLVRPLSAARRMAGAHCQFGGIVRRTCRAGLFPSNGMTSMEGNVFLNDSPGEEGVQYVKAGTFPRRRILAVIYQDARKPKMLQFFLKNFN